MIRYKIDKHSNQITCNDASKAGLLKLMINALTLTVIPSTTLSEKPYLLPVVVYCDGFEVEVCSLNSEVVPIET